MNCLTFPGFEPPVSCNPTVLPPGQLYDQDELGRLYLALENSAAYEAAFAGMPLAAAAEQIAARLRGTSALDVLALGPGHARREVALVKLLLQQQPVTRLILLDISGTVASVAHRYAVEQLADHPQVMPLGVRGDLRQLRTYEPLILQPSRGPRRCKLLLMFGGTFANDEDEVAQAADLAAAAAPGDLCLFEVSLVPAGADFRLAAPPVRGSEMWTWMQKAAELHGLGALEQIQLQKVAGRIPGSYAVEFWGHVASDKLRLVRMGRYELSPLFEALAAVGWERIAAFEYGEGYPRALCLVQRASACQRAWMMPAVRAKSMTADRPGQTGQMVSYRGRSKETA